jgi:hypothetical protein
MTSPRAGDGISFAFFDAGDLNRTRARPLGSPGAYRSLATLEGLAVQPSSSVLVLRRRLREQRSMRTSSVRHVTSLLLLTVLVSAESSVPRGADVEAVVQNNSNVGRTEDLSSDHIAQLMAEAPKVSEVALSPDGEWILYTVARGSVANNRYDSELSLQPANPERLQTDSPPVTVVRATGQSPKAFAPRWRPSANGFSYIDFGDNGARLVFFDLRTRASVPQPSLGVTIGIDYQWSPSGKRIAFTAPILSETQLDPRRGRVVSLGCLGAPWGHASGSES